MQTLETDAKCRIGFQKHLLGQTEKERVCFLD